MNKDKMKINDMIEKMKEQETDSGSDVENTNTSLF